MDARVKPGHDDLRSSLLTHRTEKRAPRPLHDAPDRALAARRYAFLTGAVVDPEIVLEIAELAVGAAMIAQRRAAGADRIVEDRTNRFSKGVRAPIWLSMSIRDGRCNALGREMRAVQRLTHVDIAEPSNDALVRERGLQRGLLPRAGLGQH